MSWFNRLMARKPGKICPLCPVVSEASIHEGLAGDKRLVPDLSPTCPHQDRTTTPDATLEALCSESDDTEARYLREERAAILEYEAELSQDEAEHRAGIAHGRAIA